MSERFDGMTYWEMVTRQLDIVSKNKQNIFKNSKATVIGCGGIGGLAIEMLARMGICEITVVDLDTFDISNLNRQVMSSFHNIGLKKADSVKEEIAKINPYTQINSINEGINEKNVDKIIKNSDFVLDGLDNVLSRVILSRACKKEKIPFIHGAIHATMGQLTVFTEKTPSYEKIFNLPSNEKELNKNIIKELNDISKNIPPAIGPVPNIIACLEAMEGFKLVTNEGNLILAPKVLSFDLMNDDPFKIIEF